MQMFKIRNKKTGQYSLGGGYPKWGNQGHYWTKQTLHQHLRYIYGYSQQGWWKDPYIDCEVIAVEVIEDSAVHVNDYVRQNSLNVKPNFVN